MNRLSENVQKHLELFCERYPTLVPIKEDILNTYTILEECYKNGGKLLIAGNGGSAADAEHIVGELMKKFKISRPVPETLAEKLEIIDPVIGKQLANDLEQGLMAIPLVAHEALTTAYLNDVGSLSVYAQQLYGYGRPGDVFLGISTSGNSQNILYATVLTSSITCYNCFDKVLRHICIICKQLFCVFWQTITTITETRIIIVIANSRI